MTGADDPTAAVLARLEGVRQEGRGWTARCPAHDDTSPSLSVATGEDGRTLLHCHAGCDHSAVLAALGITDRDMFVAKVSTSNGAPIVYSYADERGAELFQVIRQDGKQFRQRHREGGTWAWNVRGVRPVPYRLPGLIAAVAASEPIYICEGEKDADTLHRLGVAATCNPGGAGKWSKVAAVAAEHLAGASVVVVADRDQPGWRHALDVVNSLTPVARTVEIRQAREGKDSTDHLVVHNLPLDQLELLTLDQLEALAAGADNEPPRPARLITGGTFILDTPDTPPTIWGAGDEVLWAKGESLFIVGPTGVGKSTIQAQLLAGLLGLTTHVLNYPVTPAAGPVLYLAMDRPAQIQRLLHRLFTGLDIPPEKLRATLDEQLLVWRGPLPADLGTDPDIIANLARDHGAATVVIDSLKDASVKLTDDEAGGKINRAVQTCLADGIDVSVLHHDRKAPSDGAKQPKAISEVYGSTLITAGAGSVLALWGAPGDPIVELRHLKQPMSEVGPLKIEHDAGTGRTRVTHGFDLLAFLRNRGKAGATSRDVAVAWFEKHQPTDSERAKAKRALDQRVKTGHAHKSDAGIGGDGGSTGARYWATDAAFTTDAATDAGVSTASTDNPPTPPTQQPKNPMNPAPSTTDGTTDATNTPSHRRARPPLGRGRAVARNPGDPKPPGTLPGFDPNTDENNLCPRCGERPRGSFLDVCPRCASAEPGRVRPPGKGHLRSVPPLKP